MVRTMQSDGPTRAQIDAAAEAGASTYFRVVAAVDPDALGVDKNLAGRRLARATDPDDPEPSEIYFEVDNSGHFLNALWSGDLAEAFYRADATNSRILIRLLSRDLLLEELAEDRGGMEAAERFLEPYEERYGWPDEE